MENQANPNLLTTQGGEVIAPTWDAIAALHARMCTALAAIATIQKDGRHGLGYTYTTWDAAAAAVSHALTTAHLAYSVTLLQAAPSAKGALVELAFTLADTSSGAMLTTKWQATGADITQATTAAAKHWLLKTFLLSDQEDTSPTAPKAAATAIAAQTSAARPKPTAPSATPATTVPPPPPADAKVGVKWQWMLGAARAEHWTPAELATWLQDHFGVNQPALLNSQTDAAITALYDTLTTASETDIPY